MAKQQDKNESVHWMKIALSEAQKARGLTSPNPMVGAVLVKNGKELSRGYHRRAGLAHAEKVAFKNAAAPLQGATLYVTLEPCCHKGKRTPPCTEAIIEAGIKKVVVGALDPNPQVSGKGIRRLRQAGIKVETGVLSLACTELNRYYNHWMKTRTPYLILKMASSLDGRVALANGKSKWITDENSRREVHRLRSEVDAILVGIRTVLCDDPELTVRGRKTLCQPHRIILDPQLKISKTAKVLCQHAGEKIYLVTSQTELSTAKAKSLQKLSGIEILSCPQLKSGFFDLKKLKKILGQLPLISVLIEGGPMVWTSWIQQKCFEEIVLFIAPKFLGGDARAMLGNFGLKQIAANNFLKLKEVQKITEDVMLRYGLS